MQRHYSGLLLGFSIVFSPLVIKLHNSLKNRSFPRTTSSQVFLANKSETTDANSASGLLQQLNLTSQQQQQIKRIHRRYRSKISQLKQDLNFAQQQLASMMAGTASVESIRAKHQEIANFRQKLGELHFETMLATREILTPQQRQKFVEIIESK